MNRAAPQIRGALTGADALVNSCHMNSMTRLNSRVGWPSVLLVGALCITLWTDARPAIGAGAETLYRALASAYQNNPTLQAERARQRGTDEQVSQAISGWRPTIIADGDVGHEDTEASTASSDSTTDPAGFSVSINQPIFRGFQTVNSTAQAEKTVLAGQQTLLNVEQSVFFDGVNAYMNVIRDLRVVELRRQNVNNLNEQLKGTQARFNVGELTQTDVAQSRARLSQAKSDLATARSNLGASRADYVRVFGHAPGSLKFPKSIRKKLPRTIHEAIAMAEQRNPQVMSSRYIEEASAYAVDVAIGDLLPTADLQAEYSHREEPSSFINNTDTLSVTGRVRIPLYQSGRQYSEVRQAKQENHQRKSQVMETIRQVRDEVVTAWNEWVAARESIRSDSDQVKANELAYRGIQQEALVGSRTILDVLDTNRDLIESKVLLIGSRRDEVVASYRLLAAVGGLTAHGLQLQVQLYDPTLNLDRVRYKFFGIGVDESQ